MKCLKFQKGGATTEAVVSVAEIAALCLKMAARGWTLVEMTEASKITLRIG